MLEESSRCVRKVFGNLRAGRRAGSDLQISCTTFGYFAKRHYMRNCAPELYGWYSCALDEPCSRHGNDQVILRLRRILRLYSLGPGTRYCMPF